MTNTARSYATPQHCLDQLPAWNISLPPWHSVQHLAPVEPKSKRTWASALPWLNQNSKAQFIDIEAVREVMAPIQSPFIKEWSGLILLGVESFGTPLSPVYLVWLISINHAFWSIEKKSVVSFGCLYGSRNPFGYAFPLAQRHIQRANHISNQGNVWKRCDTPRDYAAMDSWFRCS
jgi:hypothetical protein